MLFSHIKCLTGRDQVPSSFLLYQHEDMTAQAWFKVAAGYMVIASTFLPARCRKYNPRGITFTLGIVSGSDISLTIT